MAFDLSLEQSFIGVTEAAAVAASKTMGLGDQDRSDRVAVEAMRSELNHLQISGRVVIGEGERDRAPMLFIGEQVGALRGQDNGPAVDIAVDPLEGTNLCATGGTDAMSVLAAAERGGLLHAPDVYMEKIIVGPRARGKVHLDAPVAENLRNIAKALDRAVDDLTVALLDRDRNRQLVADVRGTGSRVRLLRDGDLSAGLAAAVLGTGIHAVMGIGGAPEGVITAAAMRCLGGEIQGRLRALDEAQATRLEEFGLRDDDRIYSTEELAPGEQILFSATAVTDGEFLTGVRFFGHGHRTSTLFMSRAQSFIRFVDTIHREDLSSSVQFHP